ncbi:MAG: 8-oxo-dGTP diphosphatase [Patescibacteria group bacterium]
MKKQLTLCIICKDRQVLLGMKKRGFGVGRWNGFGGKVENKETIETSAIREMKEEVNLEPKEMHKVGIIEFSFENDPKILEVHIFKVGDFIGEPKESEEMKPEWFNFDEIPFQQMWPDDEYWFPYLLNGKLFRGKYHFDRPSDAEYSAKIITQELYEVDQI